MKRYSLILCLVLILSLSGAASAQIVLRPPAAGGVASFYATIGGSPYASYSYVLTFIPLGGYAYAGTGYSYYLAAHGVFEFYLGATTFPTTMTANNFTAKIGGLSVTYSTGTGAMNVDLFDMGDSAEDGAITVGDFNSTRGSRIARRTHMFSQAGTCLYCADFNNVTVTDAVRRDLFDLDGSNEDFSGFILIPNLSAQSKGVIYDPATPTLTINPGVSPPKKGGGGGGCFIANAAR